MNHEKYTQSILSGVKTWAQSLFVTKERAKDLYYTELGKVTLLKDQSLSFVDQGGIYIAEITDNDIVNLGSGETITISFDGEDYELTTSDFSVSDTVTCVVAGNLELSNAGEDTGEPFLLMVMPGNMAQIGTSLTDATHKVGIYTYGDIVHKIKPKYLPDHTHDWSDLPELPSNAIVFDAVQDDVDSISVDVSYTYLYERLVTNKEDPTIVLRLRKNSDSYWYKYPRVLYCEKWMHSDNRFFSFEFHYGLDLYTVGIYENGDVVMTIYSEYDVTGRVSIGEGLSLDANGAIGVSIGDGLSLDVNGAIRANIASIPPTDWNENDSTSASYIKNRICYSELIPDKIIATTYPDEWLSFNRVTDVNLRYSWIRSSIKREVAKEALYDGMLCLMDMTKVGGNGSYTMYGAADRIEDTSSGSVYYVFGNRYLLNDVSMDDFGITVPLGSDIDTGDKFVVVILPNTDSDQIDAIVFTSYGLTDADKTDIKTVIENVTTIDPKYLPDEVVLESELESSIPTKTSDLTNDSGFITTADIPEGAAASTTAPKMDGTAAVGTELAFARGDHVHPSDTSRVPVTRTVNGKALSSNITLSASDVNADAYGAASSALSSAKSYTDSQVAELKNGTVTVSHATNADEANHATSADIAGEADHAVLADNATNAEHATSADSATTAGSATKATQDGNGKVIATTYETKSDASAKLVEAKGYTDQVVGELSKGFDGVIRQMYADDITEDGAPTIREIAADEAGDALADAKSYADSKVAAIDYPVDSVNGKTGAVTLTYTDVGAAASSHGAHVTYSTTAPVMDGTASAGSAATVARSDHKHPTDTSRVPTSRTVNGKALSANITLSASDVGADASGAAATALANAKTYADGKIEELTGGDVSVSHATSADSATKATQDASGNVITTTYETKSDASAKLAEAKAYADDIKDDLLNGAGTAYDTLKELGDLIDINADAIDALETVASGKANASHTHGNITNAGAIGTAANKAVITTTNGVLTTGTVPVASGGTGATTAAGALTNLGITATAAELNKLDGVTATTAELNYVRGVTSNIQDQLSAKADKGHTHMVNEINGLNAMNIDGLRAFAGIYAGGTYVGADDYHEQLYISGGNGINVTGDNTVDDKVVTISGTAAGDSFGMVKSGGDVTITDGVITVNDDSHNHTIANVDGLQTALDGKAASSHGTHVSYSTTAPVMDGTAAVGTASTVARSDHKHPSDNSRVPTTRKVNGKALSADITLSASDVGAAASSHTHDYAATSHAHGNITNAGAIGTAANKAVITTTNGVLTTGTVPVAAGGTGATTAAAALTNLGLTATAAELNIMDGVTATAAEINKLDGLAAKTAELNYVIGVTSNIQTQLNTKATTGYVNDQIDGVLVALESHATGHAPSNAEKNQNAFSNVTVGSTTIAADTATDTLTLVAGSNVTITPDATNDKITIAATDTKYTHPTYTAKSSGLYKVTVDGTGHVSAATAVAKADITALGIPAQDTTYSAASTSAAGLMSAADKTKLDGIATGATKITVDTALSSTSTNPVQNKVINTALAGKAASTHTHAAGDITSGTLAVARGGTGVTANPSMLTNLGSTTAASVFAASPRPGVTGTLPIANGGTGATTPAAAKEALQINAEWLNEEHNHKNQSINPSSVELCGAGSHGGYIDFHYGGDTGDYTTRIIEESSGLIRMTGKLKVLSSTTANELGVRNIFANTTIPTAASAGGTIRLVYE